MRISMIHFRVGELDGVSLEMDKWRHVLEQLGHEVSYLAGTVGNTNGYTIPSLSLDFEPIFLIQNNAFNKFVDFNSEEEFESEIIRLKSYIKRKIQYYLDKHAIDLLIPNNMFSLPMNIPASLALVEAIEDNNLKCVNHNHDFHWDRDTYQPTVPLIQNYLDEKFPPKNPKIKHVVINSISQKALIQRKGIKATIVPNVFYFTRDHWKKDKFNSDLRKKLGIDPNDIFVLQATRIIRRKGIESAIDLLNELNREENLRRLRDKPLYDGRTFGSHNKIVLVMPNLIEDNEYKNKIESKLKNSRIKYLFCNEFFTGTRIPKPNKKYSLWDSYVHADIVTYPSFQEGWGNQFLEAIKAILPIVIFEYEVYKTDIRPAGFETISLGSKIEGYDKNKLAIIPKDNIEEATEKIIRFLQDFEYRERIGKKNYSIGLKKYSLKALEKYIKPLVENQGVL